MTGVQTCALPICALWSSVPADTLIRIVKDFGLTAVMSLVILSERNPLEAARAVYVRCACVAFPLSVLFTKYTQFGKSYSREGFLAYTGVTEQKNSLGAMVMVSILFLVWDQMESRLGRRTFWWRGMPWDRLALLLMGAWLLVLSESKTALVCTLIGLTLVCARGWLASRTASAIVFSVALSLPFLILLTEQFSSAIEIGRAHV